MFQCQNIKKLNMTAHKNVIDGKDEEVTQAFMSNGNLSLLVQALLINEKWRNKIYPHVKNHVNENNSLKVYMILFNESVVLNLLEIMLFSKSACISLGASLADLVKYCNRRIRYLLVNKEQALASFHMKSQVQDEFQLQLDEMLFSSGFISLSLLRYISDCVDKLQPSVIEAIIDNDIICQMVYLLEAHPWISQENHKIFDKGNWKPISDNGLISTVEGQIWLLLYNLIVDVECRKKYEYNTHRKETVLKLRPLITPELVDQIPILVGLQRILEELSMMITPTDLPKKGLIEEINTSVPKKDWKQIAVSQLRQILEFDAKERSKLAEHLSEYDMDSLESLLPEDPKCGNCGKLASQRCSRCSSSWYCQRSCQVKDWKKHQKLCDLINADRSTKI
jgi:hypothetical protein